MNQRKLLIGALLIGAIVTLGGLALASRRETGVLVRTERVDRRDLVATVTASGKIEPKRKVEISAAISGRVMQVAVEEGQWVNAGDLLIRIDPSQYEAALRRAEAAVAQAQAQGAQARASLLKARSDLRRAEQLARGQDLISPADVEQARTQAAVAEAQAQAAAFGVTQARAGVSEASEALKKTVIVAPMGGRVTRRNIEEGETAIVGTMNNPGTVLLTVADLSVMQATVKVDETDVPRVALGDSAAVRIDAFPEQTFTGRVTRIGNSALQSAAQQAGGADAQAVDFEVAITLDNPPATLRPDLSATAEIVTDTRRNALAVPIISLAVRDRAGKKFKTSGDASAREAAADSAAQRDDEVTGVFVVEGGKAVWRAVEVGIAGDRYFEVRRGLRGGETVVSGSYEATRELEAGSAVRVAPAAGTTSAAKAKS